MTDIFDVEQIRSICNARWLQRPNASPIIKSVRIDSREDLRDMAFVAIRGDTHDGHAYIRQAVDRGARLLIVESASVTATSAVPASVGVIQAGNTRQALGKIAQAHRRTLRGTRVVAVVGSSGKTTTKRLINGVLATRMKGVASPKSFNNDIGVPLTLLMGKPSDKFMVVEIGTNAPGEVGRLARLAEPDIGVITTIGREHLEGLITVEGVAREEAAVLGALPRDGAAIVNADCPLLRPHLRTVKNRILFGEAADADLRLITRGNDGDRWFFEVNGRHRFPLLLPGKHNAMNALAAVAVARRFGLDDSDIAAGLLTVAPESMRLTTASIGGVRFLNDAYNANPDSVAAALATFGELAVDARRRIVILGDMLELGSASQSCHEEVGHVLAGLHADGAIDLAVLIGPQMLHAHAALVGASHTAARARDHVRHFKTLDGNAIGDIVELLRRGDTVLVKGSRGMRLERVIEAFEEMLRDSNGSGSRRSARITN